jgi:hypothetical protein
MNKASNDGKEPPKKYKRRVKGIPTGSSSKLNHLQPLA